eukprot:m.264395 g.264395  ORF g.264395 m.264395 type:complete len:211 (-) comp55932_c0_seq1:81-713(-)
MHTARNNRDMQKKMTDKIAKGIKDPIENIRARCLARGASGIKGIGRAFRIMDDDGSKSLNFSEFKKGLNDYGIRLDQTEQYQEVFDLFDVNHDGTIGFDEFLEKLRPPMSQTRINLIRKAFSKLDKNGSGDITVEDLKGTYNVKSHPKYLNGEWSEDEVLVKYLEVFQKGSDEIDDVVTWEEFLNYYSGVSASIDTDAYFTLMMTMAWKL